MVVSLQDPAGGKGMSESPESMTFRLFYVCLAEVTVHVVVLV